MNTIIDFISDNDVMIMTGLLILIIVLTIIVLITDAINRRKNSKDAGELFNDENLNVIDAFKEQMNEEKSLEYTTDLRQYDAIINNDIAPEEEIKYVEEDPELEKTKAQLELKNLKEELIKADQEEKAKLNKIEEKKEEPLSQINEIDKFESDQEENAIISLEQFNKVSDKIYDENEVTQYKDEGNEPISIKELEELYNTKELKAITSDEELIDITKPEVEEKIDKIDNIMIKEEIKEPIQIKDSGFKTSPVISPVYGLDSEERINTMALENTANLDKLSEEIKKTNEFLNTLRELKKNLQ